MSLIENINSNVGLTLSAAQAEKLERINNRLKDLPEVLDYDKLTKLKDGEYDISLKEYTDMNTYRNTMNALYGNSSADNFESKLNNLLGKPRDEEISAQEFISSLKDKGITSQTAVKLYTALKSYSLISGLGNKNYNFVNAKI